MYLSPVQQFFSYIGRLVKLLALFLRRHNPLTRLTITLPYLHIFLVLFREGTKQLTDRHLSITLHPARMELSFNNFELSHLPLTSIGHVGLLQ